ncbi:MAG: hypothetical protein DRH04_05580 [Deltaproteobacteria bacterium]|nr:MAG: hypothetical protein DRH04_05580 [Deltaproteobacteria bacterium]
MALYFPAQYNSTPYRTLYDSLTPVEKIRFHREFVGVTYKRRFLYFQSIHSRQRFKDNLFLASKGLHEKMVISWFTWRRRELLPPYLSLIFRHYLFGFLVQFTQASRQLDLPQPSPSCYWATPINLVVLRWMNRHRDIWQKQLESQVSRVIEEGNRHLFIYCLLAFKLARELFSPEQMAMEIDGFRSQLLPGNTPLGVEMEFSNLGRFATFDKLGRGLKPQDPYRNMEYYSAFMLDDVTWRLGGYVDTHVRGRRLFTLSRFGGFYEYCLVRIDYPRKYSLPLTADPAIAALMIREAVDFLPDIKPHSLHVNIEHRGLGEVRPVLDDYLCLLLLGGDLGRDDQGRLRERRFAGNELRGVIQRRKHLSFFDKKKKEVVEYSFLRLWRHGKRDYDYLPVIMALKGFQYGYNMDLSCRDQVQGMMHWAQNPRPLPESSLKRFLETVTRGLQRENAHPTGSILLMGEKIQKILQKWNRMLAVGERGKMLVFLAACWSFELLEVVESFAAVGAA